MIGDRIKERLEELGYSQVMLADKASITPVSINRYIKGYREPDADTIIRIARALKCRADYLLELDVLPEEDLADAKRIIWENRKRWTLVEKLELISMLSKNGDRYEG